MAEQDDVKARDLVSKIDQLLMQKDYWEVMPDEADYVASKALREARQQGMREAAEMVREKEQFYLTTGFRNTSEEFGLLAEAIERAAEPTDKEK